MDAAEFVERWSPSGGSERSNYQLFLTELCDLLGVDHPDPAGDDNRQNAYVFERAITFDNRDGTSTTRFADLYKRGCFICETKQGVEKRDQDELLSEASKQAAKKRRKGHGARGSKAYDDTMRRAHGQAEQYARHLPVEDGRPPLLMVIDVGHRIELYSEFSQTGGAYVPFPDALSHRIPLADLADPRRGEAVRETLRLAWTDPHALDPSRRSAKVTREIAASLAKLARALEQAGHPADDVAHFLMRCLFTMFAEDVGLLTEDCFLDLLRSIDDPAHFAPVMESLWRTMDTGGFSTDLRQTLRRFNGGLFAEQKAIPLTRDQLDLMIEAAAQQWNDVEPAIFGTLLERALDPVERHKLGAHYTPRAYVERLVVPTVVEPLREEWDAARVAAITLAEEGDAKGAAGELTAFHDRLCEVRVLDPACGSGNFLYVVLEHLKRIEGEVFDAYDQLVGDRQVVFDLGHNVNPEQLLGIELNPRAAAIAELVLWIGYLQWHYRTRGKVDPPEPVIRDLHNIENRDAVLAYDAREEVLDDDGQPVTIWDGRTTKPHPVTGLEVPDESARVPTYRYTNPRKAEWPTADFVVGNPPFVGNKRMRFALGDGYVDAIRSAFPDLSENVDLVMYWWHTAAEKVAARNIQSCGLISTNSLPQSSNRGVIGAQVEDGKASIVFAVPDHPWVDAEQGAQVRISMVVIRPAVEIGELLQVTSENDTTSDSPDLRFQSAVGSIQPNLRIGANLGSVAALASNSSLVFMGMTLVGDFRLTDAEAQEILGDQRSSCSVLKPYRNGRDLATNAERRHVIDFYGKSEESARQDFPQLYQRVRDVVWPLREQNKRASYRDRWWIFGEPRNKLRAALAGLPRYIATLETSRHRYFLFLDADCVPDHSLYAIASFDAYLLGVLSTQFHVVWALASGSRLGAGNDPRYRNAACFDPFPFPDASDPQKQRIRDLGEQLDAHRTARQAEYPKLTMTGMYNVLEKLRSGETLTEKEKTIHEQGLVSVLRQIHDDLDAAVADAYGWPVDLADEEILERLVALNHERAEEEKRGLVRWLRPEYQNPDGEQALEGLEAGDAKAKPKRTAKTKAKKRPWPKSLAEQAAAVGAVLATLAEPADEKAVAKAFTRGNKDRIAELLATLAAIGKARELEDGRYVAA